MNDIEDPHIVPKQEVQPSSKEWVAPFKNVKEARNSIDIEAQHNKMADKELVAAAKYLRDHEKTWDEWNGHQTTQKIGAGVTENQARNLPKGATPTSNVVRVSAGMNVGKDIISTEIQKGWFFWWAFSFLGFKGGDDNLWV